MSVKGGQYVDHFSCLPSTKTKEEQFEDFYNTPGRQLIAGGDYNGKHTDWGSRLISPKVRDAKQPFETPPNASTHILAIWLEKLLHLVGFHFKDDIRQGFAVAKSCFHLYSDYSPILITQRMC
jgi:hypothetical protein